MISGSVALQFFERTVWPESDLDIFVQEGQSELLSGLLVNQEGYALVETKYFDLYDTLQVDEVQRYERSSPSGNVTEVQLILLPQSPVAHIISNFWATGLINFISHNKAFALFPRQTFIQKRGFLLRDLDEQVGELLRKYEKRGWTFEDLQESYADSAGNHTIEGDRWVGDKKCWTIELQDPLVTMEGAKVELAIECFNFCLAVQTKQAIGARSGHKMHGVRARTT